MKFIDVQISPDWMLGCMVIFKSDAFRTPAIAIVVGPLAICVGWHK